MTGETIYKHLVQDFDKFFTTKYNQLLVESNSITQHYDYSQDILHDCYAKVRNRIWLSGFTGTNYHGFLWMSIQNEWRVLCNRKKIRTFSELDIEDNSEPHGISNPAAAHRQSIRDQAENRLLMEDQWDQEQEQYYQRIERIVMVLFNFIETNYPERDATLFKFYFIEGTTYRDLSTMTGYSQSYISNTIKPMKRKLYEEFERYLKSHL